MKIINSNMEKSTWKLKMKYKCHTKLTKNMMKAIELLNLSTSAYDITSPYRRITQLLPFH